METLLAGLVFAAFLLAQIAAVIAVHGERTGRRPEVFDATRFDPLARAIRKSEG